MQHHAQESGSHLALVDDDFVEWFSICGPPKKCIDRLGALIEKGLDHVYLVGGSPVPEPMGARVESLVEHAQLFAKEVIPALRT